MEGSRKGTREGLEVIEERKREHDLRPCVLGTVGEALVRLVFAVNRRTSGHCETKGREEGLGSKDHGGVASPNSWKHLEVDEGGDNEFDLVEKTSLSCGGE